VIGGAIIGTFYRAGTNVWQSAEYYYEGTFYLVASLIINVTGAALLRVGKMQDKWRLKVAKTMVAPTEGGARRSSFEKVVGKYALLILAFITVFREGIEGIVFGAGVTFSAPATSVPLPVVVGLAVGSFVGWILYK
jgi:high-affinity iron transporter